MNQPQNATYKTELITKAKALLKDKLVETEMGLGKIYEVSGTTAQDIIIRIENYNNNSNKGYAAWTVFKNGRVTLFDQNAQDEFIHLCEQYQAIVDREAEQAKIEVQYQKQRDNGLKSFNSAIHAAKETTYSYTNEFYYALGWMTKHVGTITAKLPDYLEDCFIKYFGDVPRTIFDSKRRSPAGWQYQWSWCFIASLKKVDSIPSVLIPYMNDTQKAIVKTSFIWNLIDDYGFQFGKIQDMNKILNNIPATYINDFYAGYAA